MGKLNKIEEKDTNVSVHYTKLQDEDSASCDGEFLSYTCNHCGHTQTVQGRKKRMLYGVEEVYNDNILDSDKKQGQNSFKSLNLNDEEIRSLVSEDSQANISTVSEETAQISFKKFPRFNADDLKLAPWYQEGIPREIALEILSQEPVGSFMVRRSTSKSGCYALSVRVPRSFQPSGIAHYLIMRTRRGYRIKGFTKEFTTLVALITHHSVMPELLPCPLQLSRYHPIFVISDSRGDFADVECGGELVEGVGDAQGRG